MAVVSNLKKIKSVFTDFEALNFQPNGQLLYCQHQTAQILKGSEQVNIVRKWQTYTLGIQIRNSKLEFNVFIPTQATERNTDRDHTALIRF